MNQVKNLEKLNNLSFFDKNTLSQIINIKDKALYNNIQRWVKNGFLMQLKNGLYVTSKYVDNVQNKIQYSEFVANQLKVPSYLSLEYVLQKYSVLTESVFAYTSITLKSKRIYKNNLGSFIYRSIKPDLFTGFNLNRISEYTIYEATKEKALFDYLYLKFFRKKKIEKSMLDVLRLNTDGFNEEEKRKFNEYCNMVGIKKYNNLPNILF